MTQNSTNNQSGALTIDPLAASDSFLQFDEATVGKWRIGNDETNDSYKISQGSALGTNDTFVMTPAGIRSMPLQPAFLAILDTTVANVTGAGTIYTVILDNEIFDQNADFNLGTSTFTAPVTGKYIFYGEGNLGDTLVGCTTITAAIDIPGANDPGGTVQSAIASASSNGLYGVRVTVIVDMDASDTAVFIIRGANQGADNITIFGTDQGGDTRFGGGLAF